MTTVVAKKCRKCGGELDGSQPRVCRACHCEYQRYWAARNRERVAATNRSYRLRNRDRLRIRQRDHTFRRKYGMEPGEFDRMVEAQDGRCMSCGSSEYALEVDHCHQTGAVRGLLCKPCNAAAGHAGDDPDRLRLIADYLERAQR